jgi:hypothetical protein
MDLNMIGAGVIDAAGGFAYFGAWGADGGKILKINLSNFSLVAATPITDLVPVSAVIDPTAGFAYFGTDPAVYTWTGGIILKVRLSDLNVVDHISLASDEHYPDAAVIDPAHGFVYFGTYTRPGKIVKIRLSDFTRASSLTLSEDEYGLGSAVIDSEAGYAYFGTYFIGSKESVPGLIVKIRLSDFSRVANLSVDADLGSAVIDPTAGYAYFASGFNYPGRILTIQLSDFTQIGTLTLNEGESLEYSHDSGVIDPANGFAYFGMNTAPGIVVKVKLPFNGTLTSSSTVSGATGQFVSTSTAWIVLGFVAATVIALLLWRHSRRRHEPLGIPDHLKRREKRGSTVFRWKSSPRMLPR